MGNVLRVVSLLLFAALVLPLSLVSAQGGGLTAEDQALVERIRAAVIATEDYPSGVIQGTHMRTSEISLTQGGAAIVDEVSEERGQFTRTFVRDASGSTNDQTLMTVDHTITDQGVTVSYTLEVERRVVDGVLYVLATRTSADEQNLDPMPLGWVRVDDALDWPALEVLNLDVLLEQVDDMSVLDQDSLLILDYLTEIAIEEGVVYEGGTVTAIRCVTRGADYAAAMSALAAADGDVEAAALLAEIDAESYWDTTFYLDAADQIVWVSADTRTRIPPLDPAQYVASFPANLMLTQTVTATSTRAISDIGAPIVPVAAPELGAMQ